MRVLSLVSMVVVLAMLTLAGSATAQNPTQDAYSGVLGSEQSSAKQTQSVEADRANSGLTGAGSKAAVSRARSVESGSLPFTGSNVGIVVGIGIVLLVSGLAVRRIQQQ